MNKSTIAGLLLGGVLLGCGGGGSTSTPPAGANAAISGIWNGTAHSNTAKIDYSVQGLIRTDGTLHYVGLFAGDWAEFTGTIAPTGTSVAGTGAMVVPGIGVLPLALAGTASADNSITCDISVGDTGTLTMTYDPFSNTAIQLAHLEGTYTSPAHASSSSTITLATLDSAGGLTGTDGLGGSFTGTLTQEDAGVNAFTATLTYTPPAALGLGGPVVFNGVAYALLSAAGAVPQVVVQATSATTAYVFEATFSHN